MKTYDVIMIGTGEDALVAAAYLTSAGRSVLMLEQEKEPGGLMRMEELTLPGFKHDRYGPISSLLTGPAYTDLGRALEARGLRCIHPKLPTGVSLEDGRIGVFPRSLEGLVAEADNMAPGDGAEVVRLFDDFNRYAGNVFALFNRNLNDPEAAPMIKKLLRDNGRPGSVSFAEYIQSSASQTLSGMKSTALKAMLASWAGHLSCLPDEIGSGLWIPLTATALMGGGVPIIEGGSENLARSLVRLVQEQGGTILTSTEAARIEVREGLAARVYTLEGEVYEARQAIVASMEPDQLRSMLLEAENAEAESDAAADQRGGGGCLHIHLALSEPPQWHDRRLAEVAMPYLTDGLDEWSKAIAQEREGLLPSRPSFTVDIPSSFDLSRAPAGKAVMRILVPNLPLRPCGDAAGEIEVGDGFWTAELAERFGKRVLSRLGRHIQNIPSAIIGCAIIPPDRDGAYSSYSKEWEKNALSSNWLDPEQSQLLRLLPSQPDYQTKVSNLYTVGAAAWPGSRMNGGAGYIVARKLLSQRL